jgi:hypothetical protein
VTGASGPSVVVVVADDIGYGDLSLRLEGNAAMRDGDWKLVRSSIPAAMQVTEPDRAVDRALSYGRPGRITEVDASPLPEPYLGVPPGPMLVDLVADRFEQHDLAARHPERVVHRVHLFLDGVPAGSCPVRKKLTLAAEIDLHIGRNHAVLDESCGGERRAAVARRIVDAARGI